MAPERKPAPGESKTRAGHGYRNEVSWDTGQGPGQGRQPYENREDNPVPPESGGLMQDVEGGDRGTHSGVHREQSERAKGTP